MSAQDNMALAERVYDLFNERKFDGVVALANEDVHLEIVGSGMTFDGREGFRAFMQRFVTAYPDLEITRVTNQVATETAVVNEFIARGSHNGPLTTPEGGEIPPTGREVTFLVCEVWNIRDGRVATLRNYVDGAAVLGQLGLLPPGA